MTKIPPKILKLIHEIIRSEGGSKFTNHPHDTGGATKFGITAATLGHHRKLKRNATPDEVKALKKQEAIDIYYKQYILRPNYDEIEDENLQESVVDFGVNAGTSVATKRLQRMVNQITGTNTLKVDGMLGHNSLIQVNAMSEKHGQLFTDCLGYLRIKFYIAITRKNPDNQTWIRGWCNRANRFISKDNQFDKALLPNYIKGL
ncbi:MAG: N-acetylmuramidase [Gammaproteobacteria bacterium]|nr:N-acetylmuramidase [Gammaproteobacteria bacterium]